MTQFAQSHKTQRLNGAEKSAILFLCLGEERGGALMGKLDVGEIRKITRAISGMGEVQSEVVEEVMEEFSQRVSDYGGVTGSVESARGMLKSFLPEDRVTEIMDEIEVSATGDLWGDLSALDEKTLADFLRKEHNQTASVILSRIHAGTAAKVLPLLSQDRVPDLVQRMIMMDDLPAEAVRNIEEGLRREVLAKAGKNAGAEAEKRLVSLFNKLDPKVFDDLSRELEKSVPDELRSIKQKMFVFADLEALTANHLARVMREVTGKTLPMALRGADKDLREKFLNSLPQRSRDMLHEEMRSMGPVRTREVKESQSELVEAAIRLASDGEIDLPSSSDEEMID